MPNSSFNFNLPGQLMLVYLIVWIAILGWVLARKDMPPITQLMWVLVIILVPFFGLLLYCIIGPERTAAPSLPVASLPEPPARKVESIECMQCQNTIPADSAVCPKCGWSYKTDN